MSHQKFSYVFYKDHGIAKRNRKIVESFERSLLCSVFMFLVPTLCRILFF